MGYGSYTAADWEKLRNSRSLFSDSGAESIFNGNELQEKYDPRFINVREARDSEDSPLSTPIIVGFDVTGSMGYLAAEIAKNALNAAVTDIYDKQPVTNPQILCAAFTDTGASLGALQVTQFETDIRLVEQLLELKVGFGGNLYSADPLVWYFAARHTSTDCAEKRGKKGYIFCIGDELCGEDRNHKLSIETLMHVFKDRHVKELTLREAYEEAAQTYEIFHIVTGYHVDDAYRSWNEFMPGRTAKLRSEDIGCLAQVIVTVLQIWNGVPREDALAQLDAEKRDIVDRATADVTFTPPRAKGAAPQTKTAAFIQKRADEKAAVSAPQSPAKRTIGERIKRLFRKK